MRHITKCKHTITRDSRRCYFYITINCMNNSDIIINCENVNI